MNRLPANKWIRQETKGLKTFDAPKLSSPLKIKKKGRGNIISNAFGYLCISGNFVGENSTGVILFSGAFSNGNGLSIIAENLYKCTAFFTARKTIKRNWINDKDEYIEPIESK